MRMGSVFVIKKKKIYIYIYKKKKEKEKKNIYKLIYIFRWLTPIILATQEAEIRRIVIQTLPQRNRFTSPSLEKNLHKKRAGGVAQGVGPEFKPQYHKKKKKEKN
jgi:hypothetical protein